MNSYRFFKAVCRFLSRFVARIQIEGRANVPQRGPFLLIPNHQSVLDPILVQSNCPRDVFSFTKSTKFGTGFFRWLLPRLNAIPTRRYRVEPQAVRVALRLLAKGEGVGVYAEGERSWDGALQPIRRGTVRLILKTGVPVIPCGVIGSYDVWPRWSRRPRRAAVRIRFGEPMYFGMHETRPEREAALEGALEAMSEALARLSHSDGSLAAPSHLRVPPSNQGSKWRRVPGSRMRSA